MNLALTIVIVVFSTVVGALASLFLKRGAAKLNRDIRKQLRNYDFILGIFLWGVCVSAYTAVLKFTNLSWIFPFSSLAYVWSMILAAIYLHEKISVNKIIGVSLIILGIIIKTQF